jgi:hypothetical protein
LVDVGFVGEADDFDGDEGVFGLPILTPGLISDKFTLTGRDDDGGILPELRLFSIGAAFCHAVS